MQLLFYMFSTLMSLEDRLRLKLKVKTNISFMYRYSAGPLMAIPIYTVLPYCAINKHISIGRERISGAKTRLWLQNRPKIFYHTCPLSNEYIHSNIQGLPHRKLHEVVYNWDERERAPPLMMSTALASVRPSVPPSSYVSQTAHARYSRDICGFEFC